jgi:hypothetical protein
MYVDYFDFDVERLTGERVVKVKEHSMVFDLFDNGLNNATARILSVQPHAHLYIFWNFLA